MNRSSLASTETPLLYRIAPIVGICIITVVYISLFVDKGAPISEGWYTEYAWRINQGQVPYRDFALAFPPLYSYLIAGFTALFGYQLLSLRILGAILFCARVLLLYFLLRTVYSRFASFVAATILPFVLFSPVVALIQYDYTCFADVAIFSALLCTIKSAQTILSTDEQPSVKSFLLLAGAGLLAGLAAQIKQSIGLMVTLFIPIAMLGVLLCSKRHRLVPKTLGSYLIGFAIPTVILIIFLVANGVTDQFVQNCFVGAVAGKGGLVAELTNWIFNGVYFYFFALIPVSMLLLITLALKKLSASAGSGDDACSVKWRFISAGALIVLLLLAFAFLLGHSFSSGELAGWLYRNVDLVNGVFFLVPTAVFIAYVVRAIAGAVREKRTGEGALDSRGMSIVLLSGGAFAIAFGVGLSGGLATDQLAIGASMCIAMPLHYAEKSSLAKPTMLLASLSIIICASLFMGYKFSTIYSWWFLSEHSIWEQQYEVSDSEILAGMHVREADAECYEGVAELAETYCGPGDEIFVFPHCPILYDVAGYHSSTYTVVQWFDVSSASNLEADMEQIRSEPPAMLFICDIPDNTVQAHESMFGSRWTAQMMRSLKVLAGRDYVEVGRYDLGAGYVVHGYALKSRVPEGLCPTPT